jgi:hypothetical protein
MEFELASHPRLRVQIAAGIARGERDVCAVAFRGW